MGINKEKNNVIRNNDTLKPADMKPWLEILAAFLAIVTSIAAFVEQYPFWAVIFFIALIGFYTIYRCFLRKVPAQLLVISITSLVIFTSLIWFVWPLKLSITVFEDTNQNAIMDPFESTASGGVVVNVIDSTGASRQLATNVDGVAIFKSFPRGVFSLEVEGQKAGGQAYPHTSRAFIGIPENLINSPPPNCQPGMPESPARDPIAQIEQVTVRSGKQDVTVDKNTPGIIIHSNTPTLSIIAVTYRSPASSTDTIAAEAYVRKIKAQGTDDCDGRFAPGSRIVEGTGSIDLDGLPFSFQGKQEWNVKPEWDLLCIVLIHDFGIGFHRDDRLCIPLVWQE